MRKVLGAAALVGALGQIRSLAIGIALMSLTGCLSHAPTVTKTARIPPPATPVNSNATHCLSLAMYWEARGEGRRGMMAVGSVVLNRVQSHQFPNSICSVVYEGGEKPPCQFSWWCDGKSDRPRNRSQWLAAQDVSETLLSNASSDPTGGALFFHSASIRSPWHRTRDRTAKIGNHIFYR
jgi:N-acetylmuramoyl-L-alanine amidase